jgi:purine-nucleoside phosphorylase
MGAATDSDYAHQWNLPGQFPLTASYDLMEKARKAESGWKQSP